MQTVLIKTHKSDSTDIEHISLGVGVSEFEAELAPPRVVGLYRPTQYPSFPSSSTAVTQRIGGISLGIVRRLVSQHIGILPEVVRVVGNVDEDDVISMYTFINSQDRRARYRVYEAEQNILAALPELSLEFRVVNLRDYTGVSIASLSKVEGEILYDRLSTISNDELPFDFSNLPKDVSYASAR